MIFERPYRSHVHAPTERVFRDARPPWQGPDFFQAGAAPFGPLSVPDYAAWFRGDKLVTLDGSSKVQDWVDSTGLGRSATQPTAGLRPTMSTINGKPALEFDGSTQFLQYVNPGTAFTTGGGRSTFIVVFERATMASPLVPFQAKEATHEAYFSRSNTTGTFGGGLFNTTDLRASGVGNQAIVTIINGASAAESYVKTTQLATAAAIASLNALNNFYVGCYNGVSSFWKGKVGEILVYNREITSIELGRLVNEHLSPYWGI